ncbi:MAG: HU family DNA-binding protein [Gemmataceae bacterium]|nr:HU family DNA-binding protein [Gemmataceae bacterium]
MAKNKVATDKKPATKTETYQYLADATGLKRKDIATVFEHLGTLIKKELVKKDVFTLPGLLKLKRVKKPATKGGTRPDPFHPGQMMTVKPKPARNVVKALALKSLKDMVK